MLDAAVWWLALRASGYARPFFIAADRADIEAAATFGEGSVVLVAITVLMHVAKSPALAMLSLALGALVGLAAAWQV